MFKKLLIVTLLTFTAATSMASGVVCSGTKMYYSSQRVDMGTPPPPMTLIGTTVIVYDGEVLVNDKQYSGLGLYIPPSHWVTFEGERTDIESTGNQTAGSNVFSQMAVIYMGDPMDPQIKFEVAREVVDCRETWAMVP